MDAGASRSGTGLGGFVLATVLVATASAAFAEPSAPVGTELRGVASWYGEWHEGRPTASGETFDPSKLTAAHPTLPLGTRLRVTNRQNGRSVDVRVNDRGPHVAGRALDLSRRPRRGSVVWRRG
jgi:rare lipoprotein A